jgi:Pro-kumamolisin, activation domain/Bacterial Ig-like domain (group 3)
MRRTKLGDRFIPLVAASLLTFSAGGASAQTQPVRARITEAVDETNRVQLRGNVHPLARPEFDQGVVADSQPMNRMLLLLQRSPEQQAALSALMEEQLTKSSTNYHKWLTPEEFGKQFGPADADIQTVTAWLASHGFQVSKVSKGRTTVEFSGTVLQIRDAFHTDIHRFTVKGKEHVANVSDPQVPAALTSVVRGVVSLHNFRPKSFLHTAGTFRRNAKTGEVKPAFTYSDVNGTFYGVGPADFATIYNIPPAATGAGQSIAIVGQSNINLQDVADFRNAFGLPTYTSMCNSGLPPQCQFSVILNGPDPGLVSGDETESDLDVEWAGAVAQQAQIIFVTTQTTLTDFTAGVDASALYIVDNNVAPVLSESYGDCEANLGTTGNAFYNSLWQQAAAEGITVVIAAGDNGSAGCDPAQAPANQNAATQGLAVSGFASTPFNVAMGGTDFDDANNQPTYWNTTNAPGTQASAKGYIPETTWNDSCARTATANNVSGLCTTVNSNGIDLVAGSGGPSSIYTTKPSWQTGFGDSSRDIPDVSLFSSDGGPTSAPTKSFYIVCESDQDITGDTGCNLANFTTTAPFHDFQAVGGTSAATPTFAAIVALINQTTGQRQGNANYALYHTYGLAKTAGKVCNSSSLTGTQLTSNPCVFYDTTKGNVSVACVGGSPNCSNTSGAANQFGIMTTTNGGTTPAFGATAGYDRATGLGSVNVANLLASWASPSRTASTTTLNLSNTTFALDVSITVSGTVAPSTATGLVVLENAASHAAIPPSNGQSNSVSGGSYNFVTAFMPTGSYNVIAHYGGDGTFGPSDSAPIMVTVAKGVSKTVLNFVTFIGAAPILSTSAQTVAYGSPYILRVDVSNGGVPTCENLPASLFPFPTTAFVCPTGKVTLTDNGAALLDFPNAQNANASNIANLNDRGFAEDQPIQLLPGSHSITASYAGDNSYGASSSNTLSVTITQAGTTTTVTASPTSIVSGGSTTLTATISTNSNGESPCGPGVTNPGTVQFMNGSSAISGTVTYTGAQSSTGLASCTATLMTTLSALGIPDSTTRWRPKLPSGLIWLLGCCALLYGFFLRKMPRAKRLGYVYGGLAAFALAAAGIAGCGGGGGSSKTPQSKTVTITAKFSGDTNYTASSGTTTVSVQ